MEPPDIYGHFLHHCGAILLTDDDGSGFSVKSNTSSHLKNKNNLSRFRFILLSSYIII